MGMSSVGSNRPPYRTPEITSLVKRSRTLTAAKREAYDMTGKETRWSSALRRSFTDLEMEAPLPPLTKAVLDTVREQLREANSLILQDIKERVTVMDRANMRDRIEEVREGLMKDRFAVQKALGKMGNVASIDIIEHRIPLGLRFNVTPDRLRELLREGNLEEVACWVESAGDGQASVLRAPRLENIVPLLTRVPLCTSLVEVVWGMRVTQEDKHRLWVMDHHFQQISFAKYARCTGCQSKTPIALPLRLNGDVDIVTYCGTCFGVHGFEAKEEDYENIDFLGDTTDYRTVPNDERLSGEVPFDVFMKYLGRMKERKAAGLDRFHVEFLRHADVSVQEYVHHLINLILSKQVLIHEDFLVGEIRLLYKKEPASNLRNWRPVCLL